MESNRRVLLIDPLYHVHSILNYRAALVSEGFENAEFTVLTSVGSAEEAQRLEAFRQSQPRLTVRLREHHDPFYNRLQCWSHYRLAMRQVEEILAREQFDFIIYLMADHMLPFFVLPFARLCFPRHFAAGVRGLVF